MIRVAINGYGRIGRNAHRHILQDPNIDVVAINTRTLDTPMRAHLLKYDSLHGKCKKDIRVSGDDMVVDGKTITMLAIQEAKDLPWKDLNIDMVLDCTGFNTKYEKARAHILAGAKKVIVSAPMKDDTKTLVIGVNEKTLTAEDHVVSNASCTTNCIAPVLMILDEAFGIENALISSIHSFTSSQNLLDNNADDFRRARSAVQSVIPTTTGSISATGLILPNLKGKIDGMAFRVPIATSSCADMRLVFRKETTAEEMNAVLRSASQSEGLNGILGVCDEPLVSIDFKTDHRSSIVDTLLTKVVSGKYAQVISWYDNEWGYAMRLVDLMNLMGKFL